MSAREHRAIALRRVLAAWPLAVASRRRARLPRAVARAFLDAGDAAQRASAIVVQDVGEPRPLFAHDADRAMNPASVMKLVTTFAALELLGPDYRWKTEAYLGGPLDERRAARRSRAQGPRRPEDHHRAVAGVHARRCARAGLDAIDGDLVLDRTLFRARRRTIRRLSTASR